MNNLSTLLKKKSKLFKCIFITLLLQLFITYSTISINDKINIIDNNNTILFILLIVGLIIITIIIQYTESFILKQILFGIFSIIIGLLLSYTFDSIENKDIIKKSLISTLINFIIIFIFGLIIGLYGIDISWMGIILLILLLIIITISIFNIFNIFDKSEDKDKDKWNKYISIFIIILFSVYIIYDTNNILLKYNDNKCVDAALDYYLDIWNIFTSYLNLNR
jgi:FtsH-binding integral membrane protein